MRHGAKDISAASDASAATVGINAGSADMLRAIGRITARCTGPIEVFRPLYCWLRDFAGKRPETVLSAVADLLRGMIPTKLEWADTGTNLVTTVGKNNILDNHWAGSAYTAAWYGGLISLTGYSALAAADTMSSHAGWTEDQNYSQGTRVSAPWSTAASAGSKSLTSNMSYSINASTTIKGVFFCSNSTKGGTTGILCSEALFSGGDQVLQNGSTLNIGYTSTLT